MKSRSTYTQPDPIPGQVWYLPGPVGYEADVFVYLLLEQLPVRHWRRLPLWRAVSLNTGRLWSLEFPLTADWRCITRAPKYVASTRNKTR